MVSGGADFGRYSGGELRSGCEGRHWGRRLGWVGVVGFVGEGSVRRGRW